MEAERTNTFMKAAWTNLCMEAAWTNPLMEAAWINLFMKAEWTYSYGSCMVQSFFYGSCMAQFYSLFHSFKLCNATFTSNSPIEKVCQISAVEKI